MTEDDQSVADLREIQEAAQTSQQHAEKKRNIYERIDKYLVWVSGVISGARGRVARLQAALAVIEAEGAAVAAEAAKTAQAATAEAEQGRRLRGRKVYHLGVLLEALFPDAHRQMVSICIQPSGAGGEGYESTV